MNKTKFILKLFQFFINCTNYLLKKGPTHYPKRQIQISFFSLFILGIAIHNNLYAQQSTNASGGMAQGEGGSASFSIGQIFISEGKSTTGSTLQGVQQPFEISKLNAVENKKEFNLSASAFPNPTTVLLTLKIENDNLNELKYHLIDNSGNLLITKLIDSNITMISLESIIPGTYFLKILRNNVEIKSFKVVKI